MDIAGNRDIKCIKLSALTSFICNILIGRNFSETHLIQTVVIRFIANCKRSIVSQHEVRSRQSDHTHRQRHYADKGLELVFQQIAVGNLEVVGEEDPADPTDPPPYPSTREGSMMYWVIVF